MSRDASEPASGTTSVKVSPTAAIKATPPTFTRGARSTSNSRTNLARLPSLKQLTDRLQPKDKEAAKEETVKEKEGEKPALNEITTSATNIPVIAPTPTLGSRLKLPPSAVARAHLSPDGTKGMKDNGLQQSAKAPGKAEPDVRKRVETPATRSPLGAVSIKQDVATQPEAAVPVSRKVAPTSQPTEVGGRTDGATQEAKQSAETEASPEDIVTAETAAASGTAQTEKVSNGVSKSTTQAKDDQGKVGVPCTARPLGMGRPASTQKASTLGDSMIPDIVVQSSLPDKGHKSESSEDRIATAVASGQHPLAHSWTLYYDSKTYKPDPSVKVGKLLNAWEASLLHVGTFDTVEGFARHMNNVRLPSGLGKGANYHLFKDGIKPLWEDPANKCGGKWVMLVRGQQSLIDSIWSNLAMALVGQVLDPMNNVCGIVVSARPKMDRVQVWTRGRDDYPALNALAHRIMSTINLDARELDGISLEFNSNKPGDNQSDSKLMRIATNTRSGSVAGLPTDSPRQSGSRLPSMPVTSSPLTSIPPMPLPSPVPRSVSSSLPLRRTSSGPISNSGSSNPFSGPLGVVRGRLGNAAS